MCGDRGAEQAVTAAPDHRPTLSCACHTPASQPPENPRLQRAARRSPELGSPMPRFACLQSDGFRVFGKGQHVGCRADGCRPACLGVTLPAAASPSASVGGTAASSAPLGPLGLCLLSVEARAPPGLARQCWAGSSEWLQAAFPAWSPHASRPSLSLLRQSSTPGGPAPADRLMHIGRASSPSPRGPSPSRTAHCRPLPSRASHRVSGLKGR